MRNQTLANLIKTWCKSKINMHHDIKNLGYFLKAKIKNCAFCCDCVEIKKFELKFFVRLVSTTSVKWSSLCFYL